MTLHYFSTLALVSLFSKHWLNVRKCLDKVCVCVSCFSEPYFVQAVDYRDFIYFFFREIAMEYNTMGKVSTPFMTWLLTEKNS